MHDTRHCQRHSDQMKYEPEIAEMRVMQDRLRSIRERTCEPKNNQNLRYHALSSAVSSLEKAINDIGSEG